MNRTRRLGFVGQEDGFMEALKIMVYGYSVSVYRLSVCVAGKDFASQEFDKC